MKIEVFRQVPNPLPDFENEPMYVGMYIGITDEEIKRIGDRYLELLKREKPQGKWLTNSDDYYLWHECSECGKQAEKLLDSKGSELLSEYCPHCDAEMEGEE